MSTRASGFVMGVAVGVVVTHMYMSRTTTGRAATPR